MAISKEDKKKEFYNRAVNYAKSRGGECLSTEYVTMMTKLRWKCNNNSHPFWESRFDVVVNNNRWCPICANEINSKKRKDPNGLIKAKELANKKNGQCLSTEYKNSNSKMLWKCSNAFHSIWEAPLSNIKAGKWCYECAGFTPSNKMLKKMKDYAISRGGLCLSDTYEKHNNKLKWKCHIQKHNPWLATAKIVNRNQWCPECYGEQQGKNLILKDGLERANLYAKSKNGICLSNEYLGVTSLLSWKCSVQEHNIWLSTYANVVNNKKWCPECAGRFSSEIGLYRAQEFAKKKNGFCLSKKYVNSSKKMIWKCKIPHHKFWTATYSNVVSHNRWCPECSNFMYYKEDKVRKILNYLLNTEFNKVKPSWNINPKTKRLLELDGLSEKLMLAFEFQGRQHYQAAFGSQDAISYIIYKDNIKRINCEKQGIKLLIFNDVKETNNNDGLINYVLNILKENDIKYNLKISKGELLSLINVMTDYQDLALKKAQNYAKSRGGECLSKTYVNNKEKLEWKCSNTSHPIFKRDMSLIYDNNWCKLCSYKRK